MVRLAENYALVSWFKFPYLKKEAMTMTAIPRIQHAWCTISIHGICQSSL